MSVLRIGGTSRLRWGVPAALVAGLVSGAAMTGASSAAAAPRPVAGQETISTIAGGIGGPGKASQTSLVGACGVSYAAGSVYVADGEVRRINPQTDGLANLAGDGSPAPFRGDGGPAAHASLGSCGVAVDKSGNLVIADAASFRVRVDAARTGTFYGQSMIANHIYTIAGDGQKQFSGDGGRATAAGVDPVSTAIDRTGNVLIADESNNRVRLLAAKTGTFYGQSMTASHIYTIAGNGKAGYRGNTGLGTKAKMKSPEGVTVDAAGNVVIADTLNCRVRVVAASTGTFYGQSMTVGHIYLIAGSGGHGFKGDGGPATSAGIQFPVNVAVDHAGNVLVTDWGNWRIRAVAGRTGTFYGQSMTANHIYTIAGGGRFLGGLRRYLGNGGLATKAVIKQPLGVALDGHGNVVIAFRGTLPVLVVADRTGTFYGLPMTAHHVYAIAGNGGLASGDGGLATDAVIPSIDVATDSAGNVLTSASNRIQVVAARTGTFYGQSMTAGHMYPIAGNGKAGDSGNGGPATKAEFNLAYGVALDAAGNVVFGDMNNNKVHVVAVTTGTFYGQSMTANHIYTIAGTGAFGFSGDGGPATAAELANPQGVALDKSGNVLFNDSSNSRIRVVAVTTGTFYGQSMTANHIYTIAGNGKVGFSGDGGPASAAELSLPNNVALDSSGNVIIPDTFSERIRVIAVTTGTFYGQPMSANHIYTIAGDGKLGFSGDGGPATSAELGFPEAAITDAAGNVLINDSENWRIRVIAVTTGTFYGQSMKAGNIYTIAGNGKNGYAGDGGPATKAEFSSPTGLAVTSHGGVLVADTVNDRIRAITG